MSTRRNVSCEACGRYTISREAIGLLKAIDSPISGQEFILSAIARQRSDQGTSVTILGSNIVDLVTSVVPPAGPHEVLDRALLYIAGRAKTFSESVTIVPDKDYPVAFAKDTVDLEYALREGEAQELLVRPSSSEARLPSKGWERVNEIRSTRIDSDQAFVAMWFDQSVNAAWKEGIQPALEEVGYRPLRIDEKQFNDKIDDQIIAEIRRSGLVVADVTGHRGGVYFEAGFAMGLGLPIIWTCSKGEIEKAHLDTRQYNHIVWQDPEDLKTRLIARVEATGLARAR